LCALTKEFQKLGSQPLRRLRIRCNHQHSIVSRDSTGDLHPLGVILRASTPDEFKG
jgi:hypothetical protein